MSDTTNDQTLDAETLASLFEPVDETEKKSPEKADGYSSTLLKFPQKDVPEPTTEDEETAEAPEITADTILEGILRLNKEGHSECVIMATLERLHNIHEGESIEELSEDDREQIDSMAVEGAVVDIYSLDGHLFNLVLSFDSVKDAYLLELNQILNRYRSMQESIASADNVPDTDAAMFTMSLMPESLNGFGAMTLTFPAAYFRILDDNGVNASMLIQFYADNIQFQLIDMDEELKSELTADVMREMEEGTGGQIFDSEPEF